MIQEAHVKNKKSIYIVWIIPVLAMLIAGWMIFKHYDNKGYDVLVTFENGDGLLVGKTALMYNGIKIGYVSDMKIHSTDLSKIDVTITVDKSAAGVGKKGNIFWKVEPTLSLTEVTGLSTILGGVYIGVMPSVQDPKELIALPDQYIFTAQDKAPISIFDSGLNIILNTQRHDVKVGAPIMYKKVVVGKVFDSKLTQEGISYFINIDEKYKELIKKNSKFWKISGVEVRASLAGLRVEMDSLASVVAGGIAFSSPLNGNAVIKNKQNYKLYDEKKDVDLSENIITLVSNNGYDIDIKSSGVYFKGSSAGNIISLDYDPINDQTTFKIRLKNKFRHLANKDAHFWIVEPRFGLTEVKGLGAIAQGPYISFETKSKSKELRDTFNLYTDAPFIKGKHFKLIADESSNLKNGVNILYRDIIVGSLRDSYLSKNHKQVIFDIVITEKYKNLVNDSSDFYMQSSMEMDASFDGAYLNIGSISSIVNGGIVLKTSDLQDTKKRTEFKLLKNYKEFQNFEYLQDGGKTFILIADELDSIKKGSYILYKGIKVGKVISYKLNKTTMKLEIKVYIRKEYTDQVNVSTSFYNTSGIEVNADFNGVNIKTGSIETIVTGGISFKTLLNDNQVKNMHQFTLYKNEKSVDEQYVNITFLSKEDTGLKIGSSIIYKSINIGQISDMKLVDDEIVLDALIIKKYKNLLAKDSIFWIEDISININNIKNPSAIISGAFVKLLKGKSTEISNKFYINHTAPVSTVKKEGLRVVVKASKLSSLTIGSPVFYRQIKIGSVEAYRLSEDSKGVELKLFIDKCYTYLIRKNSIFYNATAIGMDISLFGVKISTETISTMINGGITMVVPNIPEEKVEELYEFKLYDKPEEDWLDYTPELINNMSTCRGEI